MARPRITVSPRATMMAVFAAFGGAIGALAGSMPSIMRNAAIDSETVGLGLTISTLMTVAAMSLGGQIARFATNRTVLLAVIPAFAVLVFAYLVSQTPAWFYLAIVPMGFAFGLTDVFMNAEASALEHDMRRPVFTAFHGAVSVGVAVMAIAASFISTLIGTWATGLLVMAGFAIAWAMVRAALRPRPLAKGQNTRILGLPHKLPLVLLGLAAGIIIAAETAALLWSAKLLDELAPSLAAIAGLGAAFYGLCNAALRFPGDMLRSHIGDMPLLTASIILATAGFAALGLSTGFWPSVAAFAAVGLGTALLIPCVFAMAAAFVPANRAGGLAFISLLTVVPRSTAPVVFGTVAAGFGTGMAFGLVALSMLVALALIVILSRTGK